MVFVAPLNLKQVFTLSIPLHIHKLGECSNMFFLDSKEQKIPKEDPHYMPVVQIR